MSALPTGDDGSILAPTRSSIETATGRFVDLLKPRADQIHLDDIACALANTCRYGGHVKRFYSVAEHSLLVHDLLQHLEHTHSQCIAGLLHDAAEAYLGDVVAPLKWALRQVDAGLSAYDVLTHRMNDAIADRYHARADLFDSHALRVADLWALRIEARALTHSGGEHWNWSGDLPLHGELPAGVQWAGGLNPADAEHQFLEAAHCLISHANDQERTR